MILQNLIIEEQGWAQLEKCMDEFFVKTGMERAEFEEWERRVFEKGHPKVIAALEQYRFLEVGGFVPVALLAAGVGEKFRPVKAIKM